MSKSKLKQQASSYYRHSPISCWILGITTGVLIAAILALDLLMPFLSILTFPLLVLPIIFSATIQHVMLKGEGQITVSSSFRTFALYFRRDFFGSYSYMFNLLKSVILFFVIEMSVSFVASTVFMMIEPTFQTNVDSFYQLIYSYEFTEADLISALEANGYQLFNYLSIVLYPSFFIAVIFLIYNLSRYSAIIYYKMTTRRTDSRFARLVYQMSLRGNRLLLVREYLSLNWPLFVLLVLGFGGGVFFGYYFYHDLFKMFAFGYIGGALLATFFLPFYFSNQQALFDSNIKLYTDATKFVTSSLIGNLQTDIDLSQEEKERLEKTLSDVDGPLNDEENNDDNKKDPEGS